MNRLANIVPCDSGILEIVPTSKGRLIMRRDGNTSDVVRSAFLDSPYKILLPYEVGFYAAFIVGLNVVTNADGDFIGASGLWTSKLDADDALIECSVVLLFPYRRSNAY